MQSPRQNDGAAVCTLQSSYSSEGGRVEGWRGVQQWLEHPLREPGRRRDSGGRNHRICDGLPRRAGQGLVTMSWMSDWGLLVDHANSYCAFWRRAWPRRGEGDESRLAGGCVSEWRQVSSSGKKSGSLDWRHSLGLISSGW